MCATPSAWAQGRGGGAWTTTGGDAQRTASVRSDPRIGKETVGKNFALLWKRTLDNPSKQPNAPTQPVLLPNIISYKGFKALAFVGGSADNVYAIDYDLSRLFWQRHLESGAPQGKSSDACPGLTTITRATSLGASGGGRGRGQGGGGAAAAGRSSASAPPPAPPMPGSGPGPNAVLGGVGGRFGGNNNVYAISSGGKLHALNPQDGTDMVAPIAFVPAGAKSIGSILIDSVLYTATTGSCGGAPNGVWAIELANDANTITKWETTDTIPGDGPAFAADGTVYVATANEMVALEPKTLAVKSRSAAALTSSPAVFSVRGKNYVVAGAKNAIVSMLDDGSKLVAISTPVSSASAGVTGVAIADESRTTWVFASVGGSSGSIAAFKVIDQNDSVTLQPAWTSRELTSPTTPLIVNGVLFALSSGDSAKPAVLYALDAGTGKELWNSAGAIASAVKGIAPSGGDGQVYVVTPDGTIYCFGIPVER